MNNQFIAPYLRKRWEDARKKVQALSPELFPQSSYLRIDHQQHMTLEKFFCILIAEWFCVKQTIFGT